MGGGPKNSLQPSLGCGCNSGRGSLYSEGQCHASGPSIPDFLSPALGQEARLPASLIHGLPSSPRTSTRTWTSGRDEPPAQDTLIPPPTAGRACPPHSPARLTTTTALVRKEEAPKWAGRARGTTQWLDVPSYRTEQGFPEISITVWPSAGLWPSR